MHGAAPVCTWAGRAGRVHNGRGGLQTGRDRFRRRQCRQGGGRSLKQLQRRRRASSVDGRWGGAHSASGLHSRRAADPSAPPAAGGPSPAAQHPRSVRASNTGHRAPPHCLGRCRLPTRAHHGARSDSPQAAEHRLRSVHPLDGTSVRRQRGVRARQLGSCWSCGCDCDCDCDCDCEQALPRPAHSHCGAGRPHHDTMAPWPARD